MEGRSLFADRSGSVPDSRIPRTPLILGPAGRGTAVPVTPVSMPGFRRFPYPASRWPRPRPSRATPGIETQRRNLWKRCCFHGNNGSSRGAPVREDGTKSVRDVWKMKGFRGSRSDGSKRIIPKSFVTIFVLSFGLLFSSNAFAAVDLIACNSNHNLKEYGDLHKLIKKISNISLVYNLAITSLCLGKSAEGMSHLQKASDAGHIAATELLGVYYERNQTFNSAERTTKSLEDLNNAIHYFTKATRIIESRANYPDGVTDDMQYIEATFYTSYYVFSGLPVLYLKGYTKAIRNLTIGRERVSYTDTLDVLNNIRATAIMCVERPSLSVWKSKRNIIYQAQQIKCEALLRFAEAVYPLEQQRIQVAQNCIAPPSECPEHQKIVDQVYQSVRDLFSQMNSAPQIN